MCLVYSKTATMDVRQRFEEHPWLEMQKFITLEASTNRLVSPAMGVPLEPGWLQSTRKHKRFNAYDDRGGLRIPFTGFFIPIGQRSYDCGVHVLCRGCQFPPSLVTGSVVVEPTWFPYMLMLGILWLLDKIAMRYSRRSFFIKRIASERLVV